MERLRYTIYVFVESLCECCNKCKYLKNGSFQELVIGKRPVT